MKFSINGQDFSRLLNTVGKVIPSKDSYLWSANRVLIEARKESDCLVLKGANPGIMIRTTSPAFIKQGGSVILSFSILSELISKMASKFVTVEIKNTARKETEEARLVAVVSTDSASVYLPVVDDKEFGEFPAESFEFFSFVMASDDFQFVLKNTLFAASLNRMQPLLAGLNFKKNNDRVLDVAAVDGHRLAVYTYDHKEVINLAFDSVTIPAQLLEVVTKITVETEASEVKVGINDLGSAYFTVGDTLIVGRVLDGVYPSYWDLMPKSFASYVLCDRKTLLNAISLTGLMDKSETGLVRLSFSQENVVLESENEEQGKASFTVPVKDFEGDSQVIGVNGYFLKESLTALSSKFVKVCYNNPITPIVLRPESDSATSHLIMPVIVRK